MRRKGVQDSSVRAAIVDQAITVLKAEGVTAVTAGRIAKDLGLSRHSVHYYFGTIEELFVAVIQREAETSKLHYESVLASDNPLRLFWDEGCQPDLKSLELLVLALKSETIRQEFSRATEAFRRMLTASIERYAEMRGLTLNVPAVVVSTVVLGVSRILKEGEALQVSYGLEETQTLLESWIDGFVNTGRWPVAGQDISATTKGESNATTVQ